MAILTVILLAAHLVAVNVASAAPLVCVWLHGRGRRGDAAADRLGRRLAYLAVVSLLVGAGLGAALVGLAWSDRSTGYWQAASRFEASTYGFAALELVFSLVCLSIYALMWDRWRNKPWLHGLLAVASATNLLYHFPPLMVVLGELSLHPQFAADETITHAAFLRLMMRPGVLSQVMHFTVASVAVAGWALMATAFKSRESRAKTSASSVEASHEPEQVRPEEFDRLISAGAWVALVASLAQLAAGLWVLVEMPIVSRNSLLGSDWLGTGLLFVSIVATFALLHLLATVALGETSDAAVRRSAWLLLLIVVLMVGVLVRVRRPDSIRRGVAMASACAVPAESSEEQRPARRATAFPAPSARPHPLLRSRPPRAVLS